MKKGSRNLLIILGVIILVVLFVVKPFGTQLFYIPGGGLTPLSLNTATFSSTDGTLNAKVIAMTFRAGGMGVGVGGTLSKDAINAQLADNVGDVGKGYTFEVGMSSERCFYPFLKNSSLTKYGHLQRYEYKNFTCLGDFDCVNWANMTPSLTAKCQEYASSRGGQFVYISKNPGEYGGSCVISLQDGGSIAEIKTPNYQFIMDSKLQVEGLAVSNGQDTITGNIASGTQGVLDQVDYYVSGNKIGYLLWQGNLSTGETCAVVEAAQRYVVNTQQGDGSMSWRLINAVNVNDYHGKETSLTNLSTTQGISYVQEAVNQVNTALSAIKVDAASSSATTLEGKTISYATRSGYDGALWYEPNKYLYFPVYTLYIKADTLNFIQPLPKVCTLELSSSATSKSGDIIPINVSWNNCGQAGNFSVAISCSGVYQAVDGTKEVYGTAGSPVNNQMRVQGTCSANQSGSCTITVKPISGILEGTPVSKSTTLSCSPEVQCTANTKWCIGNILKSCTSSGQYGADTDCVAQGKICSEGACTTQTCGLLQEKCNGVCYSVCGIGQTRNSTTCVCSNILTCGNGVIDTGEDCDGSNLNNKTCQTQGFVSGTLSCQSCRFNTTACVKGSGCDATCVGMIAVGAIIVIGGALIYVLFFKKKRRK